ncbi:MAG TPA: AMP-binding protein [Acidimicrobiales bacterium]|jgi:long-chain acyl-CoA synthetase|nr:AMP-binding protein [Acidimicrobiales bacterium]
MGSVPAVNEVTKEQIDAQVEGLTIPKAFEETVRTRGDQVAIRWRDSSGQLQSMTWTEWGDKSARAAAGLAALGVGKGDRVALMIRNAPEFHVADVAALLVGATPFSIYNSSSPEQVQYLMSHAEAKVAIVEDDGFLERFLKVRGELPGLKAIVTIKGDGSNGDDDTTWDELLSHDPVPLADACTICEPNDLATLIYTSGTTGPPKGVMITHYNVAWTVESLLRALGGDREDFVGWKVVSYLPMAHIAERTTSHYNAIFAGYEVTTCPDPGQIAEYLREIRPQLAFGVPRIWEKIYGGVQAALAADPDKKQKFDEAVEAAKPIVAKRTLEGDDALTDDERATYEFLDAVAFSQVRQLVGLDALEAAVTGAAPIPAELVEWYRAIGVPLSEIYGMSENTGPLTWDPKRVKPGFVGREIPGCTVRLANDGEVIAKGGNIFPGYLNDPEKTADALDSDGWLHTGDIGEFDDEGYLRIVDRKKELIITAGGKNISPANLEAALKSFPLIGQAAVIGDSRPFISALVVLDPDVAPGWAKSKGIDGSLEELAQHPEVIAEVERIVAEANKRFSQVEQIKKFTVLSREWQPDSEELTPTMKLKRRGINQKYAEEIEALYAR